MTMDREEDGKPPQEIFYRHFHDEQAGQAYELIHRVVLLLTRIAVDQRIGSLKDTTLKDSERAQLVNQALTDIAHLSNEVKDASNYVPAYDQRLYSEVQANVVLTI